MSHRNPNLRSEVNKDIRVLCTHVFEGGHACASPALRDETFCYYYHRPTRRRAETESRVAHRSPFLLRSPPPPTANSSSTSSPVSYKLSRTTVSKTPHAPPHPHHALQQASLNLQTTESAGGQKTSIHTPNRLFWRS